MAKKFRDCLNKSTMVQPILRAYVDLRIYDHRIYRPGLYTRAPSLQQRPMSNKQLPSHRSAHVYLVIKQDAGSVRLSIHRCTFSKASALRTLNVKNCHKTCSTSPFPLLAPLEVLSVFWLSSVAMESLIQSRRGQFKRNVNLTFLIVTKIGSPLQYIVRVLPIYIFMVELIAN